MDVVKKENHPHVFAGKKRAVKKIKPLGPHQPQLLDAFDSFFQGLGERLHQDCFKKFTFGGLAEVDEGILLSEQVQKIIGRFTKIWLADQALLQILQSGGEIGCVHGLVE